jgi:hypothetical protein
MSYVIPARRLVRGEAASSFSRRKRDAAYHAAVERYVTSPEGDVDLTKNTQERLDYYDSLRDERSEGTP